MVLTGANSVPIGSRPVHSSGQQENFIAIGSLSVQLSSQNPSMTQHSGSDHVVCVDRGSDSSRNDEVSNNSACWAVVAQPSPAHRDATPGPQPAPLLVRQ